MGGERLPQLGDGGTFSGPSPAISAMAWNTTHQVSRVVAPRAAMLVPSASLNLLLLLTQQRIAADRCFPKQQSPSLFQCPIAARTSQSCRPGRQPKNNGLDVGKQTLQGNACASSSMCLVSIAGSWLHPSAISANRPRSSARRVSPGWANGSCEIPSHHWPAKRTVAPLCC